MNKSTAQKLATKISTCLYLLLLVSGMGLASEKVVIQLKWLHQFQSAGYYAALDQGYFAEEGLDVELKERDLEQSNVDLILEGKAHYGVTDSIVLLDHLKRNGIVLVAPIFQHSPNVLISLGTSNITRPKDLVGRRLAFYDNDTDGISLLAMLAEQGVLEQGLIRDQLKNRINRLINGEVDAIAAYSTNEPYLLREMGYSVNVIDPKHYGMDFYGDILITSSKEAEENPLRVAALKRAVLRGWEYALDNKEEIVNLILEKYNTQNKTAKALMAEAQGLEPLIARHTTELGTLVEGRLEYMLALLAKTKIINTELTQSELEQSVGRLVFDSQPNKELNLSPEERAFLASNPILKVGIDRNWPPFEYLDTNDAALQGISRDYIKLLEELLQLKFKIQDQLSWPETLDEAKAGGIDFFPAITNTPERRRYLNFTQPYIRSPMIIVTDNQVSFISNMSELNGRRVAVVKGYASHEMLEKNHPLIQLDLRDSAIEALKAVAAGEVDAFIDNLAVASYLIRTQGLANLKISGQTPYSFDLSMAVQKDQLVLKSILAKALAHISRQQHTSIYDSWVTLEVEKGFPWSKFLPPFIGLGLVMLLLCYYTLHLFKLNQRIRVANCKLKKAELALKEKNAQLEKVSITDKLTGAYNRHFLDKALSDQLALALRHKRPMSIALFDLDFFKKVNDNFGHQVGDKVLQTFVELVKKNTRSTDMFGRWGGEEFLLICPETNKQQACLVVEKIRLALEKQLFEEGIKQTVSAGVVEAKQGITVDNMLSLVDQKLYLAKEAGRNKIMS
ncbi:ABC transporter substrate-binding protein [Marinospirillum minutulum]|uniref:ABC transporter substrate-binding protein n=1 Tax=Marinospirillum minutulum TaxID=64974 RepID=UPI0004854A31|nr:transporter substrate-binding domain-containing protein [Marinospirillum minutulum]